MSLKMKLTSTICAFLLILGLTIMGVMASPSATVNLGGSISFSATDVNARVTGSVDGEGNQTKPELKEILFQAEYTETEQDSFEDAIDSWKKCNLEFDSAGNPITITVTIENLADRTLYAYVNNTLSADNVLTSMEKDEAEYTGALIEIDGKGTAEVDLILEVDDKNSSVEGDWGFNIVLNDATAMTADYYAEHNKVIIERVEGEDYAQVRMIDQQTTSGDIIVPAYLKTDDGIFPVTHVADYGFTDKETVEKGLDGATLTEEEIAACGSQVVNVQLPETITHIGVGAFAANLHLQSINMPASLEVLGDMAFADCALLKTVYIDSPTIASGINASTDMGSLVANATAIYVKSGLTVGSYFDSFAAIIETVGGVEYTRYTIPVTSETRGNLEYDYTYSTKTATVYQVDATNTIGDIVIPATVTSSDEVEYSVTAVKASGFANNTSITSVKIPSSVTEIGASAFSGCTGLKTVYIDSATIASGINASTDMGSLVANATAVYVKSGLTVGNYFDSFEAIIETVGGVEYTRYKIPVTSETRGNLKYDYTYSTRTAVVSQIDSVNTTGDVVIPATVTSSDEIEYSVTAIKASGFANNTSITSVIIPDSITTIGDYAFGGCSGVTDVTIGNGVTSFGVSIFSGVTITNLTIGKCYKNLSLSCSFAKTGTLTLLSGIWNNSTINPYDSGVLSGFEKLVLGKDVTSAHKSSCSDGFKYIEVDPENPILDSRNNCNAVIEKATNKLLMGCPNTVIPEDVEIIGTNAFYCTQLGDSIVIPSSVEEIGIGAFVYCSLTSITVNASTPPTLGSDAFYSVPAGCLIYVPAESVEAYKKASGWSARADYIKAIPTES